VITETDDFFCHQTIAPHAYVALNDLSWGERAYHTLSDPDRFGLDIGVATYPNRGMFHTYAIAAFPGRQRLPGGDELTPTMKLKRRIIAEKYAATIDAQYEGRG